MAKACEVLPSLARALDFFIIEQNIDVASPIAVAVSGGADSMALLHALVNLTDFKNIHVLTVDHGLRDDSKAEAEMVGDWVAKHKDGALHHEILKWEGDKPETALLEAARYARYDLMSAYCEAHAIRPVFVAHHQDDQAETFLIRLAKGSGLDGLACMLPVQQYKEHISLCRPFLDVPKKTLIEYCEAHDVEYACDPTNEDTDYLRPRLRNSMAVLEEEGLTPSRLTTLSKRCLRARDALSEISGREYKSCVLREEGTQVVLDKEKLLGQAEEIAFRIVVQATRAFKRDKNYAIRMDRLESLFESLYHEADNFKPRTLGGLIFAFKDKNTALYIEKENKE